jgi:hypothetical protein
MYAEVCKTRSVTEGLLARHAPELSKGGAGELAV